MNEKYFCSTCGSALPSELMVKQTPAPKKVEAVVTLSDLVEKKTFSKGFVELKEGKKVNAKNIYLAIGILIFLSFIFFSYKFIFPAFMLKRSNNNQTSIVPPKTENPLVTGSLPGTMQNQITSSGSLPTENIIKSKYVLETQSTLVSGSFSGTDLVKFAPYDTVLYIEANDGKNFAEQLEDSDLIKNDLISKFVSDNEKYFSGPAAFFVVQKENKNIQVLVLKIDENKFLTGKDLEKLTLYSNGFLVLAENENIIPDIKDSLEGLTKSFSLNASFASARSLLPSSGKVEIITTGRAGKAYLFQNIDINSQDGLVSVLGEFLDSGLDYAVII